MPWSRTRDISAVRLCCCDHLGRPIRFEESLQSKAIDLLRLHEVGSQTILWEASLCHSSRWARTWWVRTQTQWFIQNPRKLEWSPDPLPPRRADALPTPLLTSVYLSGKLGWNNWAYRDCPLPHLFSVGGPAFLHSVNVTVLQTNLHTGSPGGQLALTQCCYWWEARGESILHILHACLCH